MRRVKSRFDTRNQDFALLTINDFVSLIVYLQYTDEFARKAGAKWTDVPKNESTGRK